MIQMNKKEKSTFIIEKLNEMYPDPNCELNYKKDYETMQS